MCCNVGTSLFALTFGHRAPAKIPNLNKHRSEHFDQFSFANLPRIGILAGCENAVKADCMLPHRFIRIQYECCKASRV